MIQNSLVLDHFYIGVSEKQFQELLTLTSIMKSCFHTKVEAGSESWEGIYLRSRTGGYFEILRERRIGGFGLALSPYRQEQTDANRIMTELPLLPWKSGLRTYADGSPWFDWITLGEYLDTSQAFNAWIMNYRFNPRDELGRPGPRAIDRFRRISLKVGSEYAESIRQLSGWLPGKAHFEKDSIRFVIPDREGSSFEVEITVVQGPAKFAPVQLEADLVKGHELKTAHLGMAGIKVDTGTIAIFLQATSLKLTLLASCRSRSSVRV